MKTSTTCISGFRKLAILAVMASAFISCDNILDDEYGDCTNETVYRLKFKYDYNIKKADAFANEVQSVTVYAFDEDGKFVYQRSESGDMLAEDDYAMDFEVESGDYHLVTWGGLEGDASFSVPVLTPGVSTIDDLNCRMERVYSRAEGEGGIVDSQLSSLFHGEITRQSFSRAVTEKVITVPLKKNTNNMHIILQHLSNEMVDVSKFDFRITDDNGLMNYDNSLLDDEELTYYPWHTGQATTDGGSRAADTSVNVATAELTVGRLVVENNPRLTIVNTEKNDTVLSIPLIDYLILAKSYRYSDMEDQEYLDREDQYNMTFFLDEQDRWYDAQIIINGWAVVRDQTGI